MSLTGGTRLGPYEILAPIGAGGMGEVYKARDTRLDRTVAIKVLPPHLSASAEGRQRFEREAKTISQLSHPHICALYDVGNQDGVEYLVMEYLEGDTLVDRLSRGPLPSDQTLRYGIEIADALNKAHRQGIVHRDLKPGNVMLTKSGVKLLDFGLAKVMEPGTASSGLTALQTVAGNAPLTQEGSILGTFQYMAPEQLEGREADVRSDIFAFGAVLYEMATGRKAFAGSSQASLITAIMSSEPPPVSAVQPLAPPALDRVIRTCLAKDPEERWQSAGDLGRELRWIAEGSPSGGVAAVATRMPARRGWIGWAVAGAVLLAALFLANDLRRARAGAPRAIHSFLIAPDSLTFQMTGDESAPMALSPDGERSVFGAGGKLWLQSLRTGTAAALPGTDGGRFPFWSPDSRSIGFFSEGKLKTLEASGGPIQTICDAPNSRGGAWGAGDVIVFAPDIRNGLFRVAAAGGFPAPLTRIDEKRHTTHRWPFFLPDGRHVLYLAADHARPRSAESGVYVASLEGGEPRRLMASYGSAQYASGWLLSVVDTNLMAVPFDAGRAAVTGQAVRVAGDVNFDFGVWRGTFSASGNGILAYQLAQTGMGGQLTWVDLSGRRLSTVGERGDAYSPQLSPDGRRASVILGDPNNDIWIYEIDRGVRTRMTTAEQVVHSPLWSPDGSQILYVTSPRTGEFLLVTIPSNGSGEKKVLHQSKERIEPSDWSRDGRYVLCDRGNIGAADVWAIPLADSAKAFAVAPSSFPQRSGQFSPDGRWVAYVSTQTGRNEIYVTPFPAGGARLQVSASGGTQARWGPDGRQLFYISADGNLTVAAVEARGARFEVKDVKPLFRVNIFAGPRATLHGYAVAADGQRFLVNSAGELGVPRVALVANWPADLGK